MPYPYVRLRLECGCHEVQTAPGSTDGFCCAAHLSGSPLNEERMYGLERLITLAVAAERERCARIAEEWAHSYDAATEIPARIRNTEGIDPLSGMPESPSPKTEADG